MISRKFFDFSEILRFFGHSAIIQKFFDFSTNFPFSDVKSPPALPKPTDIIIDDPLSSDDEEPNEELLQQIIQSAISNATVKSTNPVSLPPPKPNAQSALRENPMGMFRKGGASYMGMDEVTSRFHMEDSPRTYSVASGLSGLTIGSQKAELLKDNRLIHSISLTL